MPPSTTINRRRFLEYAGTVSAVGLAGCTTGGDSDGDGDGSSGGGSGGGSGGSGGGSGSGSSGGSSDDFPSDTVRVIVPYGVGGGTDIYARALQESFSEALGVPIQIDNVPGAAEMRGTTEAYHADPDGHTIIFNNGPQVTAALNPDNQPVDIADLEPIGAYAYTAFVLPARPDDGVEDFDDLLSRYESGEYEVFTGQGVGGSQWLNAQIFKLRGDIPWKTYAGYNSSGEQCQAIASGEADTGVPTETTMQTFAEDNTLVPIVTTSSKGSTTFPDLPTIEDFGLDPLVTGDFTRGVNAPPGTPPERLEVLRDAFREAVTGDKASAWSEETGNVVKYLPPDEWAPIWQEGHQKLLDLEYIEELQEMAN